MATKTNLCGFLLDEDDMASDSDVRPPSQQSVKAYVDSHAGPVPYDLVLGTDGAAGSLTVYPSVTDKGTFGFHCTNNDTDATVIITNSPHAQNTLYSIPDCGADTDMLVTNTSFQDACPDTLYLGDPTEGTAGELVLYPDTVGAGSLKITSQINTGDYAVTLQNGSFNQSTAISLIDPGVASATLPIVNSDSEVVFTATATPTALMLPSTGMLATEEYVDDAVAAITTSGANWSGVELANGLAKETTLQDGPNGGTVLTAGSFMSTYKSVEFLTATQEGVLMLVSTTGDETGYKIMYSLDDGTTFIESAQTIPAYAINDLTVLENGMTIGAIGNTGVDNFARVVGGTHWNIDTTPIVVGTTEPTVQLDAFCTGQLNGTTLFVGCGETTFVGGYTGAIYYTTDLVTWTKAMAANVSQVLKLAFTSGNSMCVGAKLVTGELGYFSSTNLTNQTSRVAFAGGPWSRIAELIAVGNNSVIAALIDSDNNTWLSTSIDCGKNFDTPVYFSTDTINCLKYYGNGILRATSNVGIYWSINRGRTWTYAVATFGATSVKHVMTHTGRLIHCSAHSGLGTLRTQYNNTFNQKYANTLKLGSGCNPGHLQIKGTGWDPGYADFTFESGDMDGSNLAVKFNGIAPLSDCTLTAPTDLIASGYEDDASFVLSTRPGYIEMRGQVGGTLVSLGGDLSTDGDFSTIGIDGNSCVLTLQGDTNVTLPTSGTLLTAADLKTRTVNLSPANFRVYDDSADYPLGFVVHSPLTSTDMILHRYADAYGIGYALNQPEASPYYGAACISIPIDGILDNSVPLIFTVDYNTTNLDYDMEIDGTVSAWPDPNEYVISTQSWDPTGGIPYMDKAWTSITFTTAGIKSIFLIVRIKALAEFRTVSIFNIKATYSVV
jgi:hypothetical protein